MRQLFFKYDHSIAKQFTEEVSIDERFRVVLWHPRTIEVLPPGVALLPFAVWWIMHHLHLFANRNYGLFLSYHEQKLIHRSVITPGYFRFPFMNKEDLQIGDTWTMPEYRGKGIATFAIQKIIEFHKKPEGSFWYIVQEDNLSSIRVVEKAGFVKFGVGARKKRIGMKILGSFEIEKQP